MCLIFFFFFLKKQQKHFLNSTLIPADGTLWKGNGCLHFLAPHASWRRASHDKTSRRAELLGAGGEEGQQAPGRADREDVVEGGAEGTQHVEGRHDNEHQVQRVVVEDGECGRLVVSHVVLLPQHPARNVATVS